MACKCATSCVAVVGMGNLLMQDDGAGVHALQALRERMANEDGVELIDGGTNAWGALWAARDCRHLLLLDAVRAGGKPGDVYRFPLGDAEAPQGSVSLHDVSLAHLVGLEQMMGNRFETVTVLGMEPSRIEPAIGLSEACQRGLEELVRLAQSEIRKVKHDETVPGAQPC